MSEDIFEEIKAKKTKIKRVGYSINEEVLESFNKVCGAKNYNKSRIIENFMKKFVEQELSLIK